MDSTSHTKIFDINNYLQGYSNVETEEKKLDLKQSELLSFYDLVEKINNDFNKKYEDSKISDHEMAERQQLEHEAAIGVSKAEKLLTAEIEAYLREQNLLGVKFPDFYESLANGIFQEIYRFGTFYKWEKYPHSPSAQIVGKEIWFSINGRFVKQKEELRSEEHIEEIIRLLQIDNSSFKVNEAHPTDELSLNNGVRVKVLIPPLSGVPTIIFRRFIVSNYSFHKQASLGTIPFEDVPFYDAMANLLLNTIFAGAVQSGKSTMLKTFYGARDPKKVVVLIESHPESFLKRDFPERLVHELYADKSHGIHSIIRDVLRIDHDYIIVQEVRGIEAEGAIESTRRGSKGTLMTYHITNPRETTQQLAQHIVDEFPNRKIVNEIRRIASQLDLGITMQTVEGTNQKKVTSVYEMCYDMKNDKAWINYLVKYDKNENVWRYNSKISSMLKEKMFATDKALAQSFISHLEKQNAKSPIIENCEEPIHFKE